jgi:hypothetical protein
LSDAVIVEEEASVFLFCVEEKINRYVALECEGVVAAAISRFLLSLLETF